MYSGYRVEGSFFAPKWCCPVKACMRKGGKG